MLKKPFSNIEQCFDKFESLYGETTLYQKQRYQKTFDAFKEYYKESSAYIASSSGRVEVLGNHTDHNGGRVMSCGISLDTLAFFLPSGNNLIRIFSEGYGEMKIKIDDLKDCKIGTSHALVCGVVDAFIKKGYKVGGFNAYCTGNVTGGAGISSSASFEVLIAEILNFLYNEDKISEEEKARISQYSENVFFGKPCGLLDQTAIAYGGLKKLDFSDDKGIIVNEVKNDLKDFTLVLVNTGGSHANLTGEYAAIPNEMFSVAKCYGKNKLIELDEQDFYNGLNKIKDKVSDRAILRAIHFYEENKRVDKAYKSLNNNDYQNFLMCVKESGISSLVRLQNCYVSGSTDQPIVKALAICERFLNGGVNRVHGGGFAGTILNFVKSENAKYFIENVEKYFDKNSVIPLKVRSVGTIVL